MGKKVYVYFYDGMVDFEFSFLTALLPTLDPAVEIISVSEEVKPLKSAYGITFFPEKRIKDIVSLEDALGLVIPGGESQDISDDFSRFINTLFKEKKLLAAICYGPLFLARAGVLEDADYTTTALPENLAAMNQNDPFNRNHYVEKSIVRDGHFITAIGSAFIDFSIEVADYLGTLTDENQKIQLAQIYKNL